MEDTIPHWQKRKATRDCFEKSQSFFRLDTAAKVRFRLALWSSVSNELHMYSTARSPPTGRLIPYLSLIGLYSACRVTLYVRRINGLLTLVTRTRIRACARTCVELENASSGSLALSHIFDLAQAKCVSTAEPCNRTPGHREQSPEREIPKTLPTDFIQRS